MRNTTGASEQSMKISAVRWVIPGAWFSIGAFAVFLGVISLKRTVFNYHTETDFVGGFIAEASRFLNGEPLLIEFHPPLYSISVALFHTLFGEWMTAGLLLSLIASLATLAISLVFFRKLLGLSSGVGSVLTLMLSPIFVYFSIQATSETFALALHMGAFLAVYISLERRTFFYYFLAGAIIGLALVTRTNHIALLALLLFYFIRIPSDPRPRNLYAKLLGLGPVITGIGIPLLIWTGFAISTGAPVFPTKNYENLALTYFSDGLRISGDARRKVAQEFTSTQDVLVADPARILRIYAKDFRQTTQRLILHDTILPFPFVALGILGWLVILIRERDRRALTMVIVLNLAAMYLLLNAKAYEPRYYLYLLPFIGAGIAYLFAQGLKGYQGTANRASGILILVAVVALGGLKSLPEMRRLHQLELSYDAYVAAQYINESDADAYKIVYARKPHLGRYSNATSRSIPQSADIETLVNELSGNASDKFTKFYLFYGWQEQRTREQFLALKDPDRLDATALRLVATGTERGGWYLYEIDGNPAPEAP